MRANGNELRRLGLFDAVITNQSVHELRHKRHAATLHRQVRKILKANAPYLVADHYFGDDGMSNSQLFMTKDEQLAALEYAGFSNAKRIACHGTIVLHRATC